MNPNPNAWWQNLITGGFVVLAILAFLWSIYYFGKHIDD